MKTIRVLFDITREVRASGWVLDNPEAVVKTLKPLLASKTKDRRFSKHLADRVPILGEPNLKVSIKHHRQLQGGYRYVAVYSFDRS